jgi:bacteriocin-like protein
LKYKGEQAIDAQASEVTAELSDKELEEVAGGAPYTQQKQQNGTAAGRS